MKTILALGSAGGLFIAARGSCGLFEPRRVCRRLISFSYTVTLPPTFIQRERDSGSELIRSPTLGRPKAEFSGFAQGDGLVTPPDFVSRIGTLLPIARCGRSSL